MEIMFDVPNHHGGDMAAATTKKEDLRFVPSQGIYCPACDKTKAHYEFNPNKTRPNGRQVYCRRCQRASQKISREKALKRRDNTDIPMAKRRPQKPKTAMEAALTTNGGPAWAAIKFYLKALRNLFA